MTHSLSASWNVNLISVFLKPTSLWLSHFQWEDCVLPSQIPRTLRGFLYACLFGICPTPLNTQQPRGFLRARIMWVRQTALSTYPGFDILGHVNVCWMNGRNGHLSFPLFLCSCFSSIHSPSPLDSSSPVSHCLLPHASLCFWARPLSLPIRATAQASSSPWLQ